MNRNKLFWTPAAVLFLITSCAPVYVPNAVNTPLLTDKNQFQLKASTGYSGTDIQSAFAVTDHVAAMANFNFRNYNENTEGKDHSKSRIGEAALGMFFPTPGRRVIFEFYSGFGLGMGKHTDDGSSTFSKSAKGSYYRFFVQQNFAVNILYFDLIYSTRASYVNFYKYSQTGFTTPMTKNKNGWFIEPVLTAKFGKMIKFYYQVGGTYPAKGGQNIIFDYEFFITNFGIEINFGQK